jgi:hypothetical protein
MFILDVSVPIVYRVFRNNLQRPMAIKLPAHLKFMTLNYGTCVDRDCSL